MKSSAQAADRTIFDRIIDGEIPAKIVYQDADVMAFHDINPQAPIHVLVIPKVKVARFSDLPTQSAEVVGRLFLGAAKVAKHLNLDERGYRVVVNCGPDAQQTVEYIHAHILAGRPLEWPPG